MPDVRNGIRVGNGKVRSFLSDVMFDQEKDGRGRKVSVLLGWQDCTVFRKVISTEDTIQEFAPALLTRRRGRLEQRCRYSGASAGSASATSTGRGT